MLLNAAVKRSVEWQERYLDGRCLSSRSRRSSVSSLDSVSREAVEVEEDVPALPENPTGLKPVPPPSNHVRTPPDQAQEHVEVDRVAHDREASSRNHRRKRQRTGRKMRMEGKRSAESFERAIYVPNELDELKPTMKPRFEQRVYRHEELRRLGIDTVKWDGR